MLVFKSHLFSLFDFVPSINNYVVYSFYFCCCRELLTYTDGNIPLAETDLDNIAKSSPATVVRKEDSTNGNADVKLPFDCMKQQESSENDTMLSTYDYEAEDNKEVDVPQKPSAGHSNAQETKMALKLSFTLPASCYATMATRELLKTSTSVRT